MYLSFEDEPIKLVKPNNIDSLEIYCSGVGYFEHLTPKILQRFVDYVTSALRKCPKIKFIKIVLSGFDLNIIKPSPIHSLV